MNGKKITENELRRKINSLREKIAEFETYPSSQKPVKFDDVLDDKYTNLENLGIIPHTTDTPKDDKAKISAQELLKQNQPDNTIKRKPSPDDTSTKVQSTNPTPPNIIKAQKDADNYYNNTRNPELRPIDKIIQMKQNFPLAIPYIIRKYERRNANITPDKPFVDTSTNPTPLNIVQAQQDADNYYKTFNSTMRPSDKIIHMKQSFPLAEPYIISKYEQHNTNIPPDKPFVDTSSTKVQSDVAADLANQFIPIKPTLKKNLNHSSNAEPPTTNTTSSPKQYQNNKPKQQSNQEILKIQQYLNSKGYRVPINGILDDKTAQAQAWESTYSNASNDLNKIMQDYTSPSSQELKKGLDSFKTEAAKNLYEDELTRIKEILRKI